MTLMKTSKNRTLFLSVVLSIASAALLLSCAGPRKNQAARRPQAELLGDYRVSVSSGGREIKDFEKTLVHYIEIPRAKVEEVVRPWPKGLNLGLIGRVDKDMRGGVAGLKLRMGGSGVSGAELGLQDNDLVTSVEAKRVTDIRGFYPLFAALLKEGKASLTLDRSGVPHKVFYYLPETKSE